MGLYWRGPWHKSWHHRSSMYCAASWTFWAKLMLIHVSYISIGAVRNGDWATMNSNEWRPPEPNPWSSKDGPADSPVTLLTSSLDHAAQISSSSSAQLRLDHGTYEGTSVTVADVTHSTVDWPSSVTGFYHSQQTKRPIAEPLPTAEKHFLFRRDLSQAQGTALRHALPPARTWADNGTGAICQDPGSMDGNCTTNRERSPALMTSTSNNTATEELVAPFSPYRNFTANESAFGMLKELELATLQSPLLEDNHTAHSNSAVNLNDHNDALCDDDSDQMEYNENCFIDHNVTCVGDPDFCNLTYSEYRQLLMDYIYPSTGEWILIASHTVVFLMGLVSMSLPVVALFTQLIDTSILMVACIMHETYRTTLDSEKKALQQVGNALVCIAVYTNHTMRTVTNIFIVNLAVADFFVILFCLPPTVVWDVTETWFMGKAMCKVVIYFQTVSVTVSVLTLTFISIDRWYAICFPLRYKPRPERAWRSIALIWLIGFLSDLPEFLVLTTRRKKLRFDIKLFTQCVATWDNETEKTFYIFKFVLLYTLPLLFMTVAYFQIVRVLWRSDTIPGHRESRNQPCGIHSTRTTLNCVGNTSTMGQLRARRKAAKMLVAVVIMFAGCYFPVHMLNVARYTVDIGQSDIVAVLSLFSHWLCYANSAVNPVIYNFMSGKFRREFKNALEKCRCLRSSHAYGGRVGGYDDRSLCHTATRLNVSPSTRSNYHLASVRDARFKQHTQQTSFNGSRHQHGRNSINHPGSLQPQISPISVEERLALTKSLDGCETLQLTNRKNSSTLAGPNGNGLGHGKTTNNGNGVGHGSQPLLQHNHHHHHSSHQQQQQHYKQHGEQMIADGGLVASEDSAGPQEQSVTAPTAMLMIVNKSSNCKIGGT